MEFDFIIDDGDEPVGTPLSGWESVVFELEDEPPTILAELRAAIEAAERLVEAWGR